MLIRQFQHVRHAARRRGKNYHFGGMSGVMRLIAGVQVKVGLGGADGSVAENGAQFGDQIGGYRVKLHDLNSF